MTDSEKAHFLDNIEANSPNAFGLVKLSELEIDEPLDGVARRHRLWDARLDIGLEGSQTLLSYAAWLGRPWIVKALLRAGADPGVRGECHAWTGPRVGSSAGGTEEDGDEDEDEQEEAGWGTPRELMNVMLAQYPAAATWTVMAMVRMRAAAGGRMSVNWSLREGASVQGERSASGGSTRGVGQAAGALACVHCGVAPPRMPVAYITCRHVACEPCAWRHVAASHGEIACPGTSAPRAASGVGDSRWKSVRIGAGGRGCRCRPGDGLVPVLGDYGVPFDAAAAKATREASLKAWCALPVDAQEAAAAAAKRSDPPQATTRPVPAYDPILGSRFQRFLKGAQKTFLPEPPRLAAARQASRMTTRVDRDRALFAAASIGDVPSVRALVAAGVNVEKRDENGFTPLMFASWRGRAGAARALLHAGADPGAVAAGGATAMEVALANGHMAVLRELRLGGGNVPAHPTTDINWRRTTGVASLVPRLIGPPPRVTLLATPVQTLEYVPSGVGALYVDDGVPMEFIQSIDALLDTMTGAKGTRGACTDADRLYFTDAQGWVRDGLESVLESVAASGGLGFSTARVLPHMRFLRYNQPGGRLTTHVDLRKVDEETGGRSTHTFCLYLATCGRGGETVIVDQAGEHTRTSFSVSFCVSLFISPLTIRRRYE